MNKSESKYFNTAIKMDKAFLEILEEKDFDYITVKEICKKAGVNRSTFYLHYKTVGDLLQESTEYINSKFLSYFPKGQESIAENLHNGSLKELYLVTPKYLTPYLSFIKEHKKLFLVSIQHAETLNLEKNYERMFKYILEPIQERFSVPKEERKYISTFYIEGFIAIIKEWLKNDCKDSIDDIIKIMERVTPIKVVEDLK